MILGVFGRTSAGEDWPAGCECVLGQGLACWLSAVDIVFNRISRCDGALEPSHASE